MYQLCRVLEHVVDSLDNASLSQHDFVPHGHEPVLHVRPDSRHQVYPVLKEHLEQSRRDVSPVCKEFAVEGLCQDGPDLRIPVVHVGSCEAERDDLSPVIADKMQLEAVTPSHRPLPVCGQSLEDLVGITAQIVADGNHRGVHETDARTASEGGEIQEEHHLEEHTALQLHKAIVGHSIWEIGLQMLTDEEQVVVLEVPEGTELEHDQNGHDLAV